MTSGSLLPKRSSPRYVSAEHYKNKKGKLFNVALKKPVGVFLHVFLLMAGTENSGQNSEFYSVWPTSFGNKYLYVFRNDCHTVFYGKNLIKCACEGSARRVRRALVQTLRTFNTQQV